VKDEQMAAALAAGKVSVPVGEVRFDAEQLRRGEERKELVGDTEISLYRKEEDAPDVRRVQVSWKDGALHLLPTKGLSIGRYQHGPWNPFWKPVRPGLISPDAENLLGTVLVKGEPVQSLRWLENFAGCVELLGLSNWGMPLPREQDKVALPLHGEASHIPVTSMKISVGQHAVFVQGTFTVNTDWWKEGQSATPWYQRGNPTWRVDRSILLRLHTPSMEFVDTLTNLARQPRVPDWGYHLQLRAEPGAELRIPSTNVSKRFSGNVERDFKTWKPAQNPAERFERGYIHKGLKVEKSPLRTPVVQGTATYPSGRNTRFVMPAAAYTLSWFSCGGRDSLEFALPESPKESLLPVAWDGMGPEIGVSSLDHDGDVDPAVSHEPVEPGEAVRLYFRIEEEG